MLTAAADGVVRFCTPIPSTKKVEWVDPVYDMGMFAAGKLLCQLFLGLLLCDMPAMETIEKYL